MKRVSPRVLFLLLAVVGLGFLAGCASTPVALPQGLSAGEVFQHAQDAVDRTDYALAIRYYATVKTSFPDDVTHVVWAAYEIAFLNHKLGKNVEALTLINELLDTYKDSWDTLPPATAAPHILAEKLKARLESLLPKKP
jgi:outer membrane protein assembly factor BamD (BamD/ComL family)